MRTRVWLKAADFSRWQTVAAIWPLPANETVALGIYGAFWIGVIFGAVMQQTAMRGGQ